MNPADLQYFILRAKNNGRQHYIDFIKDVRRATGSGLKDAKDFVDYLTQGFVE
jgi:ribosomal protein L7/L12